MNRLPAALTGTLLAAILASCANGFLPAAHRHPLQQGNLITAEEIAQLRVGMSEEQVRYLLGSPITPNLSDDGQWLYTFTAGRLVEPGEASVLALHFESGRLHEIDNRYDIDSDLARYFENVVTDFD